MQIDPKLKEILRFFYNEGRIDGAIEMYNFDQVIKDNERKILALGKPEPLAKNKQTENKPKCICDELNRTQSSGFCHPCRTSWV